MTKSSRITLSVLATAILASMATLAVVHARHTPDDAPPTPALKVKDSQGTVVGSYRIPSDSQIAALPDGKEILYGKRLLNETARLLPTHVGDGLNCNSCHLAEGKLGAAGPYINAYNTYPTFKSRAGRKVSLTERINGCFQRSMNGVPLAPDSREMLAMKAYMKWLAQGVPTGDKVDVVNAGKIDTSLVPDPVRGKQIYGEQCASCHGDSGEGMKDQFGDYIFPPLWGNDSYNIGAGMARTYKAAAFIKYNMPLAAGRNKPLGQGGVLTDQDAVDVAQYFTHQPRPDFPGKINDWKNQKKPKDARY